MEAHNKYRAKHGAPALTLNRELCDIAKKWAKRLAADKAFKHSEKADRKCKNGNTGENLYYSGTTGDLDVQGTAPVDSWYGEIKDYNFDKPSFAQNTGKPWELCGNGCNWVLGRTTVVFHQWFNSHSRIFESFAQRNLVNKKENKGHFVRFEPASCTPENPLFY